jgi:hypothetical protein
MKNDNNFGYEKNTIVVDNIPLRRSPHMFPPAIWNVPDATVNGDARTNNMCEGWNNKFFNLVGHARILLDNSTDSSFFLLTPLDHTPYRRMGMSYQVEELVVPALAHVVGSGITVDCGIR